MSGDDSIGAGGTGTATVGDCVVVLVGSLVLVVLVVLAVLVALVVLLSSPLAWLLYHLAPRVIRR